MSVGRYIMHQKLSDGSYEDVYCKSESGLIYRPNGRTVEQDLAAYLPEYQNSDTVPENLPFGTTGLLVNPSVNGFEGFIFHFWTVTVPDFTLERMVA